MRTWTMILGLVALPLLGPGAAQAEDAAHAAECVTNRNNIIAGELARSDEQAKEKEKAAQAAAERDLKVAQFYDRTGHAGSAVFYYQLICRRYPGTNEAAIALQRLAELVASSGNPR